MWISVEDRLPVESKECKYGDYVLTYNKDYKIRLVPAWSVDKLHTTHWQPLPPPP